MSSFLSSESLSLTVWPSLRDTVKRPSNPLLYFNFVVFWDFLCYITHSLFHGNLQETFSLAHMPGSSTPFPNCWWCAAPSALTDGADPVSFLLAVAPRCQSQSAVPLTCIQTLWCIWGTNFILTFLYFLWLLTGFPYWKKCAIFNKLLKYCPEQRWATAAFFCFTLVLVTGFLCVALAALELLCRQSWCPNKREIHLHLPPKC